MLFRSEVFDEFTDEYFGDNKIKSPFIASMHSRKHSKSKVVENKDFDKRVTILANKETAVSEFSSMEDKSSGSISWDTIKQYFKMLGIWRVFLFPISRLTLH